MARKVRRWVHEKIMSHRWETVSHRHDVDLGDERFDCYRLEECDRGAIREGSIKKTEIPSPFPGLAFGFAEVSLRELARLEDSMVWCDS